MSLEIGLYTQTFFDRAAVQRRLKPATRKALARGGALTQKIAKQSIRPPRRKSLSEMKPEERKRWEAKLRRARRLGLKRPRRPLMKAGRGEPPRNKSGFLRNFIYFGYDTTRDTMTIGPVALRTRTAHLLEHGGSAVLPVGKRKKATMHFSGNPFMRPAMEKAVPKIPAAFRNAVSY